MIAARTNSSNQNKKLFYVKIQKSKLTARLCHEENIIIIIIIIIIVIKTNIIIKIKMVDNTKIVR